MFYMAMAVFIGADSLFFAGRIVSGNSEMRDRAPPGIRIEAKQLALFRYVVDIRLQG